MSAPIVISRFPKQLSTGHRPGGVWPRADQAHFALQDVEQLRQLVQAGTAQEGSQFRNPFVVLFSGLSLTFGFRPLTHGAKLVNLYGVVLHPDPLLNEQHRPRRPQLDEDSHQRHQRRNENKAGDGQAQIEQALCDTLMEPKRSTGDNKGRRFVQFVEAEGAAFICITLRSSLNSRA